MDVPTHRPIPDREYFRIGEVAELLGVPPSAVRFWREQFAVHVRPQRTRSQQWVFSRRDLSVLALVRFLLHDRKLSIRDARARLAELLAEHDGDVSFIALEQAELPLDGPEPDAPAPPRGFLARLDESRVRTLEAEDRVREAEARAADLEARIAAARAELLVLADELGD